uniref:Uncharacterized protein n=1 Tax=Oryza glumipatula TaxID=40148 RepID=A0A0E0BQE4_9ORYZ
MELHGHQLTHGPNVSVSYTPLLLKPTSRVATAAAAAAAVHHCRSHRCSAPPTSNSHRRRRLPSDLAHAPALFAGPSEGGRSQDWIHPQSWLRLLTTSTPPLRASIRSATTSFNSPSNQQFSTLRWLLRLQWCLQGNPWQLLSSGRLSPGP